MTELDPDGDGPLSPRVTRTTYDLLGNVTESRVVRGEVDDSATWTVSDPEDLVTSTTFDRLNRPLVVRGPNPDGYWLTSLPSPGRAIDTIATPHISR